MTITQTKDVELASALLAQAFADDPVTVWMDPDTSRHRAMFRTLLVHSHGRGGSTLDLAMRDGQPVGAAAWDPPGHKISTWAQIVSSWEFFRTLGPRVNRGIKLETEFAKYRPKEPPLVSGQIGAPGQRCRHRHGAADAPARADRRTRVSGMLQWPQRAAVRAVRLPGHRGVRTAARRPEGLGDVPPDVTLVVHLRVEHPAGGGPGVGTDH